MTLREQITADMKDAMRAKDMAKLGTIRLITSALKQQEVDERVKHPDFEVTDAVVIATLEKMVKQRKDSIQQYEAGGRADLADVEKAELVVLQAYLPEGLSAEEIKAEVQAVVAELGAAGPKDMGKVMSALKTKLAGRADMTEVSALVKAALVG